MKNKLYFSFIYHYIVILLIPFIIIISLCIAGAIMVNNEAIKANSIILETLSNDFDSDIESLEEFYITLQTDTELTSLLAQFPDVDASNRYDVMKKLDEFQTAIVINTNIVEFLIYLPERDYVINSTGYFQISRFNDQLFATFFTKVDDYQMFLESNRPFLYMDENGKLFYIRQLQSAWGYTKSDKLIIEMNIDDFDKTIEQNAIDGESVCFLVLDENDSILYTNNLNIDSVDIIDEDNYVSINKKNDYYAYRKESENYNISYIALIPSNIIYNSLNILYIIIGISLIILALSIFLIFKYIKNKKFIPVESTISLLDFKHEKNIDAYYFIQENVVKLVEEKKHLIEDFANSKEYLTNYFVIRTLTDKIENPEEYKKLLEYYNIKFEHEHFRILTFYKKNEGIAENENDVVLSIKNGIISAFQDEVNIYSVTITNMIVVIMNYNSIEASGHTLETLEFYKNTLIENDVVLALSKKKTSFLEIHAAYEESLKAIDQCLIDGDNIKEYQEYICGKNFNDIKYYKLEENLKAATHERSIEKAKSLFNNMFTILKRAYAGNPVVMRYRLYGILNVIMSEFIKNEDETTISSVYMQIASITDIDDLYQYILKVLNDFQPFEDNETEDKFIIKVEQFVADNLYKNELSVGLVADKFDMDSTLLSKKFKKNKGINILDYIHETRISRAKTLLLNTRSTVKIIAEECGYLNADVFIRAFKRYEGVTPGKYREEEKKRKTKGGK
ncbi:MAG: helix-turn-helix transcriptional regulator [Lachnospiraceae bacterium]